MRFKSVLPELKISAARIILALLALPLLAAVVISFKLPPETLQWGNHPDEKPEGSLQNREIPG